jgi:thiol-disulfide isomerase/thioredoxin
MNKLILISTEWCGACTTFKPTMEEVSKTIPVEFHDAKGNDELVLKYKVSRVPTLLLVDENGTELNRMTGNQSKERVLNFYNQ